MAISTSLSLLGSLAASPALAAGPRNDASAALQLPDGRASIPMSHGRDGRLVAPTAAWQRLRSATGGGWSSWNALTGVVAHVIPRGLAAPGTVADPDAAAAFASDFLSAHIQALAPGASASDFVLVSNEVRDGVRALGFAQHHRGLAVLGGQLSLRFKADRLVLVASQAFAHVEIAAGSTGVAPVRRRAEQWLTAQGARVVHERVDTARVILPIVRGPGQVSFAEVTRATFDLEAPRARFEVYYDVITGEPLARHQRLAFGTAQARYNVPQRSPGFGERFDAPASATAGTIGDTELHTDGSGSFEFDGAQAEITLGVTGEQASVANVSGEEAQWTTQASDGSTVVWDARDDELVDAQLTAYIHAQTVKEHVRLLAPDLFWLASPVQVNVNIDDQCNAFSDGDSINFFVASEQCENTGRIADVVYHEFGHSVHSQSLVPGVGSFDVALSEGISDYLSATITGDSGVGRGFFYDETPLRQIDPSGHEYRWPDDRGEVHSEGRIIAGALWDLRKRMVEKLGEQAGVAFTDNLWYQTIRRASDIPSMYVEALVSDDDDGDLGNGTPNGCDINATFGPHGLFTAGRGAETITAQRDAEGGVAVELMLDVPSFPDCPVHAAPELTWRLRDAPSTGGTVSMQAYRGSWVAAIPSQADGSVIQYQVRLGYDVDPQQRLPHNVVDPWFEHYVGEVVPLHCTGFEEDDGWSLGPTWTIGNPAGSASPVDPQVAHEGEAVLHIHGSYGAHEHTVARSPKIDTRGYERVRLQYWRWLSVEDGYYDQASIRANDEERWSNFASSEESSARLHHVDEQWRFHDIDITDAVVDGQVDVAFVLKSDAGLHLGGWTVDSLCVVGVGDAASPPECGDGIVDRNEDCDDGNQEPGDGCDETCTFEGDTTDAPADTGSSGDSDGGTSDDGAGQEDALSDRGCGCTTQERPWSELAFIVPALVWLRRRRSRG